MDTGTSSAEENAPNSVGESKFGPQTSPEAGSTVLFRALRGGLQGNFSD